MSEIVPDALPDALGHYGPFGGRFVPEALMAALQELTEAFESSQDDPRFAAELADLQVNYAGRPTPISEASNFGERYCGGARILLKREDLNHTGSHKINNVLGQGLLTRRMGKRRVIAETGAGQHGVAAATIAALMGFECRVYMGRVDTDRQALNVARMQLLGAEVVAVEAGSATLKDAMNEAMRDWVTNVGTTHYLIGTASGPAPFPQMVKAFQSIISKESRAQMLDRFGALPDAVCACVGGGSNAIGSFAEYIADDDVALYGFEAGGRGVATGEHAASINGGSVGVLHGTRTFVLQDDDGQTVESHSISAGLDYPGVGPEHAYLARIGRAHYEPVDDDEAMTALDRLARCEGIMPAIESAHAVAGAQRLALRMLAEDPDRRPTILVTVSGRGDKDVDTAMKYFGVNGDVDATTGRMS
ncbi:tryptophan synthase, beta subunit [Propionibacterium acidifaciens F0233]|uniref:Tryptophan synthase beta chain n=1 Tax=Propionibacterium acidifaciens F0233 TaxID=553198 RepID=U2S3M9_9ACTN|nr:tryptophan synthase subunit beta [Propionibacterium acidifaciens]AYW78772.1 tryptophan synthase subunit beta [Propionibacterium acidifaciens]ERK60318.1 tryptophan synthase, beta subunit [Propionibacterium acidifaciens F0233]